MYNNNMMIHREGTALRSYSPEWTTIIDSTSQTDIKKQQYLLFMESEDGNHLLMIKCIASDKNATERTHVNHMNDPKTIKNANKGINFQDWKTICNGIVDIVEKSEIINDNQVVEKKLKIIFKINGNSKTIDVSAEYFENKKYMQPFLRQNGLVFLDEDYKYIKLYLDRKAASIAVARECVGFQTIENTLTHSNQSVIMQNAPDAIDMWRNYFNVSNHNMRIDAYIKLALVCASACQTLWYRELSADFPTIVFVSSDFNNMLNEVKSIFCHDNQHTIVMDKDFEKKISNFTDEAAVLLLCNETQYKRKKYLSDLSHFNIAGDNTRSHCMRILLTDSFDDFDSVDSDNFVIIPFRSVGIKNGNTAMYWFQKMLINSEEFRAGVLQKYNEYCADDGAELVGNKKHKLFSLMRAIIYRILLCLKIKDETADWDQKTISQYLYNLGTTGADCIVDEMRGYITNNSRKYKIIHKSYCSNVVDEKTILCDSEYIYVSTTVMRSIALDIGVSPNTLCKELKRNNMLYCDGEKHQKNVAVGNKTTHMYVLKQSDFFTAGDLRLDPHCFTQTAPNVMIEIGRSNSGKKLYYYLDKADSVANGHCSVFGSTGTGKSYFLANFAKQAARQNKEVMFICRDDSENEFIESQYIGYKKRFVEDNKSEPEIIWSEVFKEGKIAMLSVECNSKNYLDKILKSFYDYKCTKKESKIKDCFLIVDECQDFDLSQNGVLVDKMLKKGRKLGIKVVIASQCLNRGIAENLDTVTAQCTTRFEFKSSDCRKSLALLNVNRDNKNYATFRDMLENMSVGMCLAKGNICTDHGKIDYQITVSVPENTQS